MSDILHQLGHLTSFKRSSKSEVLGSMLQSTTRDGLKYYNFTMVFLRTGARGTFIQKSVIIILAFICIASLLANREKVSVSMMCGLVLL